MLWLEILLLVGIIAYSAKLGGIGVGMAGAVGMIAATAVFGLKPGFIPVDVMLIIMTVILAISVMQRAGGLAFMVKCAEKLLRQSEIHQRTCTSCLLHADDFRRDGLHGNERFKRHSGSGQGK